jgi:hypothetical protein
MQYPQRIALKNRPIRRSVPQHDQFASEPVI